MSELKPCPLCGEEVRLYLGNENTGVIECPCGLGFDPGGGVTDIAALWNKRTPAPGFNVMTSEQVETNEAYRRGWADCEDGKKGQRTT